MRMIIRFNFCVAESIRGRMLEQFVRLKLNLHRCRHISGNAGLNHRKEPALVLYPSRDAEVGTHPIIAAHTKIGQRAATGNEFLTDLLMPEIELQAVARAEPVVRPRLCALPSAADPIAKQI